MFLIVIFDQINAGKINAGDQRGISQKHKHLTDPITYKFGWLISIIRHDPSVSGV